MKITNLLQPGEHRISNFLSTHPFGFDQDFEIAIESPVTAALADSEPEGNEVGGRHTLKTESSLEPFISPVAKKHMTRIKQCTCYYYSIVKQKF